MRLSYGHSRSRVNENDLVAYDPDTFVYQQTMGLISCHAASHTTTTFLSPNNGRPQAWGALQQLAKKFPTIVADLAYDNFANDAGIQAVDQCVTYLQGASSPARAKPGKVLLLGTSMGFATACAWARTHLSQVAGIAGIVPFSNMNDAYVNNVGGTVTAAMNTAYGGTYDASTMGPTHDPIIFASQLNVPIKLWYGTADATVPPASVLAFAAAAPNVSVVPLEGLQHDTELAYTLALQNGLMEFLTGVAG